MKTVQSAEVAADESTSEQLEPEEVSELLRRHLAGLSVSTMTPLDECETAGLQPLGWRAGGKAIALALLKPFLEGGPDTSRLVTLAAPGLSSPQVGRFCRHLRRARGVRRIHGRTDHLPLLEALLQEGWRLRPTGRLYVHDGEIEPLALHDRWLLKMDATAEPHARAFLEALPEGEKTPVTMEELPSVLPLGVLEGLFEDEVCQVLLRRVERNPPHYTSFRLSVLPQARRKGLASAVLSHLIAREQALGRNVIVALRLEEVGPIALLESIGARVDALYFEAEWPSGADD